MLIKLTFVLILFECSLQPT